jgi:hypothetical protein
MELYRWRRHRAALRRRAFRRRKKPAYCATSAGGAGCPREGCLERFELRAPLGELAKRLRGYPGVHGLLYRLENGRVELTVVAPSPMTRPLQLLSTAWVKALRENYPTFTWKLGVVAEPPEGRKYRCAFWRDD